MPTPLNGIAELIQSMQERNEMLEKQIESIQDQINSSKEAIETMSELAEWGPDVEIPPSNLPAIEYPPQTS